METFTNETDLRNLSLPSIGLLEGMMLELSLDETDLRHFFFDAKDINQTYVFELISNDGIIDWDYYILNQRTKLFGEGLLDKYFLEIPIKNYSDQMD